MWLKWKIIFFFFLLESAEISGLDVQVLRLATPASFTLISVFLDQWLGLLNLPSLSEAKCGLQRIKRDQSYKVGGMILFGFPQIHMLKSYPQGNDSSIPSGGGAFGELIKSGSPDSCLVLLSCEDTAGRHCFWAKKKKETHQTPNLPWCWTPGL